MDVPHDSNAAGPSFLAVKKGTFPTHSLHDPSLFSDHVATVKRAETRQCPICSEYIPVRLLGAHCDLETQRTEEVIRAIGSLEVYGDSVDGCELYRTFRVPSLPVYALRVQNPVLPG